MKELPLLLHLSILVRHLTSCAITNYFINLLAGNLLRIKNFLSGRSQVTRIGHFYSTVTYLSNGVV